jgi:hypothetical protein
MKAKEFIPVTKPRNFVAKNAPTSGAGRHKDSSKKKDQEQGKVKHKKDLVPMESQGVSKSADQITPNWAKYVLDQIYNSNGEVTLTDLFDEGIPGLHAMFIDTAHEHGLDPEEDFEDVQHELTLELENLIKGGRDMEEGWSDAYVARRTGQPRTPYSVYIKGKKWKDFENDDHAEAVANKLKAKFKADGRNPETITIAPTEIITGEAAVNPQFINVQVTKILAREAQRMTNAPIEQLLAPLMKEYNLTLQQINNMVSGGLKKAAAEYGVTVKGVTEGESALEKFRKGSADREKKHDAAEKEMKARHASGKEDMKGSIDRLEKQLNNK